MKRRGVVGTTRIIDAVESAYQMDGADEQWVTRLLETLARDLDLGVGIYGFTARHARTAVTPDSAFVQRELDPRFFGVLAELNRTAPNELDAELAKALVRCGGLEQVLGRGHAVVRHFRASGEPAGIVDGFTMYAHDGQEAAVVISSPARKIIRASPDAIDVWHRAGLHFATALRLRRKLRAERANVEALVTPSGDIADASGVVRDERDARERLRHEVRRVEKARTRSMRREPDQALSLWKGLCAGRWSLVDRWDTDARRYIAVHENLPLHDDPRALTRDERTVAHYVGLGASNKEIAYALGLPMGTVATLVRAVVRKLGGTRRSDVIGFARGEALSVDVGGERVDVLRAEARLDGAQLTAEERALVPSILRGDSNAAIARARRTSEKTVANQLYGMFQKLGVESRAELVAKLTEA